MRSRADFRDQQEQIVAKVFSRQSHLIVAHMGSGKTAAALTAINDLLNLGDARRVLVVAPLLVAREVWPCEPEEWRHLVHMDVAICVGNPAEREAAIRRRAIITAVNRETLPWLWEHIGGLAGWEWDTVVIDESSMFKSGRTRSGANKKERAQGSLSRFGVIAAALPKIEQVIELTGTPAPNGHEDLWGQMYLLDRGERLGRSKNAFLTRWFYPNRGIGRAQIRPHAAEEIEALIADRMMVLERSKDIPEPVYKPVPVTLPPAAMKEYKRFERTLVSEVYNVEAVSKGVLTGKLLQFANGGLYRESSDDPPQREVVAVHEEKLKALETLIEEAGGDNVLVFYSFKFDLDRIRERFPHAVVLNESDSAVKDWNAGRIRLLLAHPASCAHGLNLQYGGHIAIWFGLNWSLELYQQANSRLPRPGQENLVVTYQIIAKGTMDETQLGVLERKGATQDSINSAVRKRLLALT